MHQSVFHSPRILRVVLIVLLPPWLLVAGVNLAMGILVQGVFNLGLPQSRTLIARGIPILLYWALCGYAGLFTWAFLPKGMSSQLLYRPDQTYRAPRGLRKILVVVAMVQIPSLFLVHISGPLFWVSILADSAVPLSWRLGVGAYLVLPLPLYYWSFSRPRGPQGSGPSQTPF